MARLLLARLDRSTPLSSGVAFRFWFTLSAGQDPGIGNRLLFIFFVFWLLFKGDTLLCLIGESSGICAVMLRRSSDNGKLVRLP